MIKLFAQVTHPNAGYKFDSDRAQALIASNSAEYMYEVERIDIGRNSTEVFLKDYKGGRNSVNFSFFVSESGRCVRAYDIFANPLKMKRIQSTYINMLLN